MLMIFILVADPIQKGGVAITNEVIKKVNLMVIVEVLLFVILVTVKVSVVTEVTVIQNRIKHDADCIKDNANDEASIVESINCMTFNRNFY